MTDILKSIRDIAFLFAIYLYFAGWTYRWYYLDYFGLSLTQADMEFYYFFVYAFDVLLAGLRFWMTWAFVACVLATWGWGSRRRPKSGKPQVGAIPEGKAAFLSPEKTGVVQFYKTGWVILMIVLFPFLFYLAKTSAWKEAERQATPATSDLRQVQLVFTDDFMKSVSAADTGVNSPSTNMNDFLQFNRSGQLRLLLAAKDDLYLLYRQGPESSIPVIYDLSKDDIKWMAFLGH
jgi:hypothetical protein